MHYYPHHVGDYQRDTATLSVTEHGAYRLLMDAYYVTESPLPSDHMELCRVCRAMTKAEQEAVKKVSAKFFELRDGLLYHKRIDIEIADYRKNAETNRENGKKGGRPPKQKPKNNPMGFDSVSHSDSETITETKGNQEPVTILTPTPLKRGIVEGDNSDLVPTTDQAKRIASIFHRKHSTPWTKNEVRAYKAIGIVPEDDLAAVERHYADNWPPREGNYLRRDMQTFLNNFPSEIERAKAATHPNHATPTHINSRGAGHRTDSLNHVGRYPSAVKPPRDSAQMELSSEQ